jgi:hypothetical protein
MQSLLFTSALTSVAQGMENAVSATEEKNA